MKILITGIDGFLGSHLRQELESRGHEVYGCDLTHKTHRADIADIRQLEPLFIRQPDVVYNLAGEFGRKNGDDYYEHLWRTNVIGTRNVIELCIKYKVNLIHASSSEAYGDLADKEYALHEEILNREVPVFHNEYALSKFTNDKQIEIGRSHGLNAKVLRFFNVYGHGEVYSPYRSVVCQFCYQFLHDMNPVCYRNGSRSFLYVDDWSRTVANVAERYNELKHDTYNIASEENASIEDLVGIIKELVPESKSQPFWMDTEQFNVASKRADVSRAIAELSHKQTVSLADGVKKTLEWMKDVDRIG